MREEIANRVCDIRVHGYQMYYVMEKHTQFISGIDMSGVVAIIERIKVNIFKKVAHEK